jgi:hypothetical protein
MPESLKQLSARRIRKARHLQVKPRARIRYTDAKVSSIQPRTFGKNSSPCL